jgi:hypothetical protein
VAMWNVGTQQAPSPGNACLSDAFSLQVSYRFRPLALLSEPLLLVAFFLLLFVGSILSLRLDLTLAKSSAAYQADLHRDKVTTHHRCVGC